MTTTRHSRSPSWFCALPDTQAFAAPATWLRRRANRIVQHASGRLWLAGEPGLQEWRVVTAGPRRVAFIGFCLLDDAALGAAVDQATSQENLSSLTDLPGSFQLLVSTPEMLSVYTDPAGLRRLFHTRYRSGVLIGDRAAVLASITGASTNEEWLAARLVCPETPFPIVSAMSPYIGVKPLLPGHRLTATETKVFDRRYWIPPDANQTIGEAARGCGTRSLPPSSAEQRDRPG